MIRWGRLNLINWIYEYENIKKTLFLVPDKKSGHLQLKLKYELFTTAMRFSYYHNKILKKSYKNS